MKYVNVISRRKLREFYEGDSARKRDGEAFDNWFRLARKATWRNFQDVKALFGQTDVTKDTESGRTATIFDIGGNKYRIIALVDYMRQTVLITHVLTHSEYDKENWQRDL